MEQSTSALAKVTPENICKQSHLPSAFCYSSSSSCMQGGQTFPAAWAVNQLFSKSQGAEERSVSASVTQNASTQVQIVLRGIGTGSVCLKPQLRNIWGDDGTVLCCISLHKYCALTEAPTSVNSQNHSLENKKYFGAGAMTTKMLLEKDKRGSVINTDSHQKGTPTRALTSSSPHQSCPLPHCRHQPVHTTSHQEEDVPKQQEKPDLHQNQGRNRIQMRLGNSQPTPLFFWATLSS